MTWDFDISTAPKGEYVDVTRRVKGNDVTVKEYQHERIIAATECGKVIVTRWLPKNGTDGDRWEFFPRGSQPIAWQRFPEHPNVAAGGAE